MTALLPGFMVLAWTESQLDLSRHAEVRNAALRNAQSAAFEIQRFIADVQVVLVTVSHVADVRNIQETGCAAYIADLRPELTHLTGLSVLDLDGRYRCGFKPASAIQGDFSYSPIFLAALKAQAAVIGEYTIGSTSGRPVLPIALAVRDGAGRPLGVLVASLDLAWLDDRLKERGLPPGGSITVADRNGVIIAREPLPERFIGTKIPDQYMRLVNASESGSEEVMSQDGTRRVLGYVPLSLPPVGLYVSVGLSSRESYGPLNRAARIGAVLAILSAAITLMATWLVGQRVFIQPIEKITDVLQKWRAGDRAARTGYAQTNGELGELGAELDRLMDEIARSNEQRDLLARELEHRVKNTLATVQSLAASTMNRVESGKALLPNFLARIAALARTHEVLTRERWDSADFGALLLGVLRPLIGEIEDRVTLDGPEIELSPSQALGMTMVTHELCTNALKYGALCWPTGRIDLTWNIVERSAERWVTIVWRERDGPPVVRAEAKGGFGTRLIARALSGIGQTEVDFDPAGLICRIEIRLAD